jgi:drug/metabolite transporter (DMT)-like permease
LLPDTYFTSHSGEFASLLTAAFWTVTALAFESACNEVGSLAVNYFRLILGFILLSIVNYLFRGLVLPVDAGINIWIWLSLSGLVGFVIGDYCLFKSFILIGSNLSMLIMTLVPAVTSILGLFFLHEKLSGSNILGILITMAGIIIASYNKINGSGTVKSGFFFKGILYALVGVLGQSGGLILSKFGMGNYNCLAATQIRIIAAIAGFSAIVLIFNRTKTLSKVFKNGKAIIGISVGSFFGPFLGVTFSLYAIQHTSTGIASTIMATVPVLIIAPSIIIFKRKISLREISGAVISVLGVVMFFL